VTAVLALLSSACWGTADFLGGLLAKRYPALVVVALSQALALVLLLVWATGSGHLDDPTGYLPWAIAGGVAGPIALSAFYSALASGTMGVVAPLASCGALVPVVVGVADGERPSLAQVCGIVAVIGGVILAAGPEVRRDETGARPAGARSVALAGLAALGFGIVFVALARGSEHSVPMTLTVQRATSVTVLVVLVAVWWLRTRPPADRGPVLPRGIDLGLVAVIGVGEIAANGMYAVASTSGLLAVVSVLASLYPVVTILLARFVLDERLARGQQAGVVTALVGVVVIAAGGGAA